MVASKQDTLIKHQGGRIAIQDMFKLWVKKGGENIAKDHVHLKKHEVVCPKGC